MQGDDLGMDWTSDFRHASRGLLRTPGFLVTTVLTLAVAIGAVVGMFNVVYTVLLRPLPFPEPDRLVVLSGSAPGSDLPERFGPGQEFYLHYKERRSEEHTSELQSQSNLVCRLLLEKK